MKWLRACVERKLQYPREENLRIHIRTRHTTHHDMWMRENKSESCTAQKRYTGLYVEMKKIENIEKRWTFFRWSKWSRNKIAKWNIYSFQFDRILFFSAHVQASFNIVSEMKKGCFFLQKSFTFHFTHKWKQKNKILWRECANLVSNPINKSKCCPKTYAFWSKS